MWLLTLVLGAVLELWVFVQVANAVGFGWALLALVGVSVVGLWLVKLAGLGVLQRAQDQLAAGGNLTREAVDGVLLLVAGLLVAVPGFVTGALGLLLVLPPSRAAVRSLATRRLRRSRMVQRVTVIRSRTVYRPDVRDTTATDEPPGRPPGELGRGAT